MKPDRKAEREAQIAQATYDLLVEKGYAATSMLSIAKRAKCSNETLYNWYGDKLGLIRSLVTRNAAEARAALDTALAAGKSPMETLDLFGPVLLQVLLGDRAIALNRAAAADPTGALGRALSQAGRETFLPRLTDIIDRAVHEGTLATDDPAKAVELYLGLLIGDLQIRRAIGRVPPLPADQIKARSDTALTMVQKLLS